MLPHELTNPPLSPPCRRLVMEVTLVQSHNSLLRPPRMNRRIAMHSTHARSLSILSEITDNSVGSSISSTREPKTVYNDNWFDRLAIHHLSHSLQSSTGLRSERRGYDGLIEAATMASRHFTPIQQRSLVIQTLETAFPKPIMSLAKKIKALLPPSKLAREYFAVFTTIFFSWLVGPCEVKESELEGKKERNVVYVPKCRFLEGTNCVGMCTNLCKMPSQAFIKESLGMPINMVPNFEDMSCEMIFGQEPPSQSIDPAFIQPCFKQCKEVRKHHRNCTS